MSFNQFNSFKVETGNLTSNIIYPFCDSQDLTYHSFTLMSITPLGSYYVRLSPKVRKTYFGLCDQNQPLKSEKLTFSRSGGGGRTHHPMTWSL